MVERSGTTGPPTPAERCAPVGRESRGTSPPPLASTTLPPSLCRLDARVHRLASRSGGPPMMTRRHGHAGRRVSRLSRPAGAQRSSVRVFRWFRCASPPANFLRASGTKGRRGKGYGRLPPPAASEKPAWPRQRSGDLRCGSEGRLSPAQNVQTPGTRCACRDLGPRRATVECGDLSPLSQGDLSPSNCGRREGERGVHGSRPRRRVRVTGAVAEFDGDQSPAQKR